jgi:hypothetical protein
LSAIERDEAQHVWEALAALPAHQHLALFLREVEHRPYQEIGQILGISETAAGLCLFRGRRSFAATYTRVHDLDAGERCMAMRRLISLQIDGQATAVQDHALNAHLNDCSGCRNDVKAMRLSSQRYAGLFLAPVPMLAHADVLSSVVQAKAAGSGVIGKLVAFLLSQGKTAAITIVLVTSAAAAPQAVQIAVDRFEQTERSSPIGGTGSSSESAPVAQAMEHESVGSDPAQSDPPILPSIATPGAELIDDAMRLVPPTDELLADPVATADELLADPVATADELLRDVAETSDAALSDVLAPLPDTDLPLASPSLSLTPFP